MLSVLRPKQMKPFRESFDDVTASNKVTPTVISVVAFSPKCSGEARYEGNV